jgi:hypothetical protein
VDQVVKLLSAAAAGALDVWVGIIAGLALGLSPALSSDVSIASAVLGVTLAVARSASGPRVGFREVHRIAASSIPP